MLADLIAEGFGQHPPRKSEQAPVAGRGRARDLVAQTQQEILREAEGRVLILHPIHGEHTDHRLGRKQFLDGADLPIDSSDRACGRRFNRTVYPVLPL